MEALAVQVLGTVLTILGLIVVAPYEAGRMLPASCHALLRLFHRPVTVNFGSLTATTGLGTLAVFGRVGLTDQGTTEEQVAALRHAVSSINGELDGLRAEDKAIRAELTAKLDQLSQDQVGLRRALDEQRQALSQLNARGFPLAALGALLAGAPSAWFVAAGWWLAGPLLVLGGVAALVAGRWLWDAPGEMAAGWHAFRAAKHA